MWEGKESKMDDLKKGRKDERKVTSRIISEKWKGNGVP